MAEQDPKGNRAEYLKKRFSAGATPTANDYADLIDLADGGRKAVGLSEDLKYVPGSTPGLVIDDETHCLKVNFDPKTSGLKLDANHALSINPGKGIALTADGVEAHVAGALVADASGVHVKVGEGLQLVADPKDQTKQAVALHVEATSGLTTSDSKLGLNLAKDGNKQNVSGLTAENGLQLLVDKAMLALGKSGLGLTEATQQNLKVAVDSDMGKALDEVQAYTVNRHGEPEPALKLSELGQKLEKTFRDAINHAWSVQESEKGFDLKGWAGAYWGTATEMVTAGNGAFTVDGNGNIGKGEEHAKGLNAYFYKQMKEWIDNAVANYGKNVNADGKLNLTAGSGLQAVVAAKLAQAYVKGRDDGYTPPEEFYRICKDGVDKLIEANGSVDSLHYADVTKVKKIDYPKIAGVAAQAAWRMGTKSAHDQIDKSSASYLQGERDGINEGRMTYTDFESYIANSRQKIKNGKSDGIKEDHHSYSGIADWQSKGIFDDGWAEGRAYAKREVQRNIDKFIKDNPSWGADLKGGIENLLNIPGGS